MVVKPGALLERLPSSEGVGRAEPGRHLIGGVCLGRAVKWRRSGGGEASCCACCLLGLWNVRESRFCEKLCS